jgi:hypothetical protein
MRRSLRHERHRLVLEQRERLGAVARLETLEAVARHHADEHLPQPRLVVDDEDAGALAGHHGNQVGGAIGHGLATVHGSAPRAVEPGYLVRRRAAASRRPPTTTLPSRPSEA